MHSGLHTSVGWRRGGMGCESVFSQRETPTLLPGYGSWMECMGTLGTTELHEEASRQHKAKSRRRNLNMQGNGGKRTREIHV